MKEISGTTKVLGLIGNPVRHTLSPVIHNTISEELGRDMVYLPFPVEEDPVTAVNGAFHLGISGLNVTVPHKTAVIPALQGLDDAAAAIGAVNTLVRTEGGYKGYNTDMPGLTRAINTRGIRINGRQVVVLGAGGASRAVCTMALTEGASAVYLINRTKEKAVAIANSLNSFFEERTAARIIPLSVDEYKNVPVVPTIFFQCTSLGLHPGDGLLVDDREFYKGAVYGYDLIYNPAETPFLKLMKELKIEADNGLSMLLYQGVIAYELWTGEKISEDLVQKVKVQLMRKVYGGNVILCGYMGSGKSTVGKALAAERGMDFLDTDAMIEEGEDCTIREIFETRGETAFRDLETKYLEKLSVTAVNTVIATGGGMVLRGINRELMKKTGQVVWLKAGEETTFDRVKNDTGRPLLDSAGEEELRKKISAMLKERGPAYEAAADRVVETDGKTVEEILEML